MLSPSLSKHIRVRSRISSLDRNSTVNKMDVFSRIFSFINTDKVPFSWSDVIVLYVAFERMVMQSDGGSWNEALDLRLISHLNERVECDLRYGIGRIQIRLPIITGHRLIRRRCTEGHSERWRDGEVDRPDRRRWRGLMILVMLLFITLRFLSRGQLKYVVSKEKTHQNNDRNCNGECEEGVYAKSNQSCSPRFGIELEFWRGNSYVAVLSFWGRIVW